MWGIDIVGVLPIAKGGAKCAIVVTDYFTKWLEAESNNDHGKKGYQFCGQKHYLSIWDTEDHHN